MRTYLRDYLITLYRQLRPSDRSRRGRAASIAANQVEVCEPRQLLSATSGADVDSAFCDPVTIINAELRTDDRTPLIEWNAVEGASEYEIFVANRGSSEAVFRMRGLSGTSIQITQPLDFGEYTVWVRARGADAATPWGSGERVRVDARTEISVDGSQISWSPVEGATEYRFWMDALNDDGSVLKRQAFLFSVSETHVPLSNTSGRFKAWVQPVRLDGQTIQLGTWSSPVEFELSDAPDINEFDFKFGVHEYLIEQGEVRNGEIVLRDIELYYGKGAIPDAGEYLLRIHAATMQTPFIFDGTLRYLDQQALRDALAYVDVAGPSYLYQMNISGAASATKTVFSTTPIANLTRQDLADLGDGPLSVKIRISRRPGAEQHDWSVWSKSFEFSVANEAPTVVLTQDRTNPKISLTVRADVSSFDESELVWEGIHGTPKLQTKSATYNIEVFRNNELLLTQLAGSNEISLETAGHQPGDYEVRVRSRVGDEASEWSDRISFTIDPAPTNFQLVNFSPIDRTPTVSWAQRRGTSSYRVVVTGESGAVVYTATLPGTPQFVPFDSNQEIGLGIHQLTKHLPDGVYTIGVDVIYENGMTSLPTSPLEFVIGARSHIVNPNLIEGSLEWMPIEGATAYQVWINAIDDSGNTTMARVVVENTLQPRFDIPTHLAAGLYRTWVQAIVRDADGRIHKSFWSPPAIINLAATPETISTNDWVAAEYHVEKAVLIGTESLEGDLPEYTLRIGRDRPVEYHKNRGNGSAVSALPFPISHTVYELQLQNLSTGIEVNRNVSQDGLTGNDVVLDLAMADVASLGTGEIAVRIRQRTEQFLLQQSSLKAADHPLADIQISMVSRFGNWSEDFHFSLGTGVPGTLRSIYLPGPDQRTLIWPEGKTVRRFDESKIIYGANVTNIVVGIPDIEETRPQYEVWITNVRTRERVIFEQNLTEPQFTMPASLAGETYRAWFRTVIDGGEPSEWSRSVDFDFYQAHMQESTFDV